MFCRNVLIYLSRTAAESFLDRLADCLAPGGLVFLGYSEAVLAPTPRLRVQRLGATHALQVVRATEPAADAGAGRGAGDGAARERLNEGSGGLWTTGSTAPSVALASPTGGPGNGTSSSSAPSGPATPERATPERATPGPATSGPVPAATRPATAAEMTEAGEVSARRGDHAGAVIAFRKAVFLDPDQPVVWFQLGVTLGAVRDRRGAMRAFSAALAALERCDPGVVEAGLDGWAAAELAGVLRDRLGRP